MMKTKQDHDLINHAGVVYIKNDTDLSWLIGSSVDCDENQIGQLRDSLYRCGLC